MASRSMQNLPAGGPVIDRGYLGFDYFAAAEAGGADADVFGGCAYFGVNGAQVDVPSALADVVGVTDGVSELRPLAADITYSCHNWWIPSGVLPKGYFTGIGRVWTTTAAVSCQRSVASKTLYLPVGLTSARSSFRTSFDLRSQVQAALPITGWAQKAQRRASMGISLRHSGHFFVVGSAGAAALRVRAMRALMGVTTKK